MLKMLLPLDGSNLAECVLPHALAIAGAIDAEVTLLRIVTPSEFRNGEAFNRVDWRLHRHEAQTYLESIGAVFDTAGIPCQRCLEEGRPAEIVLKTARELGAQLLILSTHGCGAAIDFPCGSVAGKVLSAYEASVLLVGAQADQVARDRAVYDRLLVPIDGSHESECALRVAISLAQCLESRLSVVYLARLVRLPAIANRDPHALALSRQLTEVVRLAAERELTGLRARLPAELNPETAVVSADESDELLTELKNRFDPNLIVSSADASFIANTSAHPLLRSASIGNRVPLLVLNPRGIGDAFCESRRLDGAGVRTADVS